MPNEIIKSDSNNFRSFKEMILRKDEDSNLINKIASDYSRIPALMRALNNFLPSGIPGALDQFLSEKEAEREQENTLRALYLLATRVLELESKNNPRLSDEMFKFLFYVYKNSETDIFSRIDLDLIQNQLGISQNKTISLGQYLTDKGFIKFPSWDVGIGILHNGILKIESELFTYNDLPEYVNENEILLIRDKMQLRLTLLQHIFKLTGEDTYKKINHLELANISNINHDIVLRQLLPYLYNEGWVKAATSDTIKITEDGIEFIKG